MTLTRRLASMVIRSTRRPKCVFALLLIVVMLPLGSALAQTGAGGSAGSVTMLGGDSGDDRAIVGDTRGREFWLAFPRNALLERDNRLQFKLFITSDRATNGTVSVPGLGKTFSFPPSKEKPSIDSSLSSVALVPSPRIARNWEEG